MTRTWVPVTFILALAACGGGDDDGDEPACLTNLQTSCDSTISAGFDSLYRSVLQPRCGVTGSGATCHNAGGQSAGLDLSTPAIAFQDLLASRVKPGDPACSVLMQRLVSEDPKFRMPQRGQKLDAGLLCAVQQWIQAGAEE